LKNKILIILIIIGLYLLSPLLEIALGIAGASLFDLKMRLTSRETIERKMDNETDINKKIKLIVYFADTGINDDYVVNKLEDMLYNTIPNSTFHHTAKDLISIGLVMHLARSNRDDRFLKLVKIASNKHFSFDTRWIALRKLYYYLPQNTTVDKSDIKARLQQLSQQILSSPNDFKDKDYQEMLYEDVLKVIQTLEEKKL